MSLDRLLAVWPGRKVGAGRYRGPCPACGGSSTSAKLSARELGDGRVLLHCFGTCDVGEVVSALGLELHDLFPPRANDRHQDDRTRPPRERQPFDARDALRLIDAEVHRAALLMMVAGLHDLTAERRTRLAQAAATIRNARRACGLRTAR